MILVLQNILLTKIFFYLRHLPNVNRFLWRGSPYSKLKNHNSKIQGDDATMENMRC